MENFNDSSRINFEVSDASSESSFVEKSSPIKVATPSKLPSKTMEPHKRATETSKSAKFHSRPVKFTQSKKYYSRPSGSKPSGSNPFGFRPPSLRSKSWHNVDAYNFQLQLATADNPDAYLVTAHLTRNNYISWSRAMLLALSSKEKLNFIL
ncbi:hypothetical protein M5689_006951 [Euphorbia peplus]|nr:hypothetical protein M5689_006951 [Euphorbia peplus]